jgi:D-arabinose 1-dehydrogenase-like Zn-dependent alcohol dehydrogenase
MYIALDADYLTILPDDIDPKVIGPVLCAGVTAYKVCKPPFVPWSSNM